jgi:hypothetical protein
MIIISSPYRYQNEINLIHSLEEGMELFYVLETDFTAEEIQASLLLLLDWNIGILQSHHHLAKALGN